MIAASAVGEARSAYAEALIAEGNVIDVQAFIEFQVSLPVSSNIKRHVKNDLGPLGLVKRLRNELAHGSISFTECADDVTVAWLVELKDMTANYLREVVARFVMYVETHEYLIPEKRPA